LYSSTVFIIFTDLPGGRRDPWSKHDKS